MVDLVDAIEKVARIISDEGTECNLAIDRVCGAYEPKDVKVDDLRDFLSTRVCWSLPIVSRPQNSRVYSGKLTLVRGIVLVGDDVMTPDSYRAYRVA